MPLSGVAPSLMNANPFSPYRSNPDIAGQSQRQTGSDTSAVNGGDYRFFHLEKGRPRVPANGRKPSVRPEPCSSIRRGRRRAKSASRPGQNRHFDAVVFADFIGSQHQALSHLDGDCIQLIGGIKRNKPQFHLSFRIKYLRSSFKIPLSRTYYLRNSLAKTLR